MLRKRAKQSIASSDDAVQQQTQAQRPITTGKSVTKGPPLGSKKKINEDSLLKKRVFGGEDGFTRSLASRHKQPKQKKKRSAASLNAETRKPVWQDGDDTEKKEMFEKLTETPKWARLNTAQDSESEEDSDLEDMARRTGTNLMTSSALPPNYLQIKRCPDANSDSPNTGKVTCVRFHPTAQVVMTASTDQSIRLFQVDGRSNPKIQNVFLDNFPVMSAEFSASGEEVIMGSKHRSFYYFDMMAGKVVFVPKIKGLEEKNMARLRTTPDGKFIVFLGSYGNLHLVSAKTKEWIHTLHVNGGVADVTFSRDGSAMFATGDDGRVYVFDLTTRQCTHHFFDDGCVHGTSICLSHDSQYLACGSNTGVVNVYDKDTCLTSRTPRPLKAIMNLTTSCTSAVFNSHTEMLAVASNVSEKAVKLVHFPSFTVFANYPEMNDTKIRIPWTMDFSPNSGYFCIGNHKGQALLYRLKHYSSY